MLFPCNTTFAHQNKYSGAAPKSTRMTRQTHQTLWNCTQHDLGVVWSQLTENPNGTDGDVI
jgi:hypothetical protein